MKASSYVRLLEVKSDNPFVKKHMGGDEEELTKLNTRAGSLGFLARVDWEEGAGLCLGDSGHIGHWPMDCMEPVDESSLSRLVDLGEVDCFDLQALKRALMKLVSQIEFLGSPVRICVMLADIRLDGDSYILGGSLARQMTVSSISNHKDQRVKPSSSGVPMGLASLLGGMNG